MTFWETIERGEYVMFALAVLFILTVCIWWVRAARLHKIRKGSLGLMPRVRDHVMEGDIESARQVSGVTANAGGRVLDKGLSLIGRSMEEVKSGMLEVSDIETEKMRAGLGWLRLIAIISPLMGACGTLAGIVDRLRDLGESEAGVDLGRICGDLAPTIVTTIAGLGVGIFALLALTGLEGSLAKSKIRIDELREEFADMLNEPT
ncbi:MAG: MotA/TolQ/ExbB proton channel family protein [Muribaculaceae bacterium]|nr:MotA/TolQ/ExbB proton channel family protein [Muribaculaceae bacterium]